MSKKVPLSASSVVEDPKVLFAVYDRMFGSIVSRHLLNGESKKSPLQCVVHGHWAIRGRPPGVGDMETSNRPTPRQVSAGPLVERVHGSHAMPAPQRVILRQLTHCGFPVLSPPVDPAVNLIGEPTPFWTYLDKASALVADYYADKKQLPPADFAIIEAPDTVDLAICMNHQISEKKWLGYDDEHKLKAHKKMIEDHIITCLEKEVMPKIDRKAYAADELRRAEWTRQVELTSTREMKRPPDFDTEHAFFGKLERIAQPTKENPDRKVPNLNLLPGDADRLGPRVAAIAVTLNQDKPVDPRDHALVLNMVGAIRQTWIQFDFNTDKLALYQLWTTTECIKFLAVRPMPYSKDALSMTQLALIAERHRQWTNVVMPFLELMVRDPTEHKRKQAGKALEVEEKKKLALAAAEKKKEEKKELKKKKANKKETASSSSGGKLGLLSRLTSTPSPSSPTSSSSSSTSSSTSGSDDKNMVTHWSLIEMAHKFSQAVRTSFADPLVLVLPVALLDQFIEDTVLIKIGDWLRTKATTHKLKLKSMKDVEMDFFVVQDIWEFLEYASHQLPMPIERCLDNWEPDLVDSECCQQLLRQLGDQRRLTLSSSSSSTSTSLVVQSRALPSVSVTPTPPSTASPPSSSSSSPTLVTLSSAPRTVQVPQSNPPSILTSLLTPTSTPSSKPITQGASTRHADDGDDDDDDDINPDVES